MVTPNNSRKTVPSTIPAEKIPTVKTYQSIQFWLEKPIFLLIQLLVSVSLNKRGKLFTEILKTSLGSDTKGSPYPQYYFEAQKSCAVNLPTALYEAIVTEAKRQGMNPTEYVSREITKAQPPELVAAMKQLLEVLESLAKESASPLTGESTNASQENPSPSDTPNSAKTENSTLMNGKSINEVAKPHTPIQQPSKPQNNQPQNDAPTPVSPLPKSEDRLSSCFKEMAPGSGSTNPSIPLDAPLPSPQASSPTPDRIEADFRALLGEAPPATEEAPF